ncbi:cytoplasmic protein [Paenibacillus pectinilyticus]|uniref:Cytoplasmic protein n=1 Tax=Paenibacillus pectinilyticus TaxID=512399 RepID=A0A1C0ZZL7_9BACL|nr:SUMF1/EgtB/PvdO family nonheme iron enzyme [Paenibacillus pectinilyticus]OCT13481.1 cytoplasmic protein [Paenibacillus pectinilyticus]
MSKEIINDVNYPMVAIPAGEIELRDDRTKKRWAVAIQPFLLAPFPITVGRYVATTGDKGDQSDQKPLVNMSWQDAISFCNLLSEKAGLQPCYSFRGEDDEVQWDWSADGYRLPTEAEWQYACKAGSTGYIYGDLDKIAWFNANSGGMSHEVGRKEPNAWGLYDMLGNVWEWCWDIYDEQVYGSYRVFRGGSWAEEARGCGSTCRRRSHPTLAIDDLGFRVARSMPKKDEDNQP